jgi:hypothetical protein
VGRTTEGQSIYHTSSLIAQGAVRTGVEMGNAHVFEYYRDALDAIASEGLGRHIQRISGPYREAVAAHLDLGNPTYTERWLERRRKKRGAGTSNS